MTITERYNDLKAKEPGVLVLMRTGDFYETFDADAKVCNEVLGLALTQRNGKAQVLTGFPKHALDTYLPKLIRGGYRVRICDDTINNNSNNNNSNNNQTIMEQNFAAMRVSNVYWFDREREALVQLTLVRSSFNLISHKARHEWAETDGDPKKVVLMIDYDPQEPGKLPSFYESVEQFEKGQTIKHDALYHMDNEQTVCSQLLKGTDKRNLHNDEKGCFEWAFIKGQAVKWYFREHIDWVTWHYESAVVARATSDADGGVPDNYYSCEEVYQYNDWTEVKPDGTRVKHEGVYNRLRLEHDQEELADRLQQAIDACKAAGMEIYFNFASYDLNAVNVRHIERLEYDPEVNEETEVAHYFDDSRVARAFNNVFDLNTEDSEVKFVVKKEA